MLSLALYDKNDGLTLIYVQLNLLRATLQLFVVLYCACCLQIVILQGNIVGTLFSGDDFRNGVANDR